MKQARSHLLASRLLLIPSFLFQAATALAGEADAFQRRVSSDSSGRVVATVTTLDRTVHMPGVKVDLTAPYDDIVIATTTTDGRGMDTT